MCEELRREYHKFVSSLTNNEDKKYWNDASKYHIEHKKPGVDFYEWSKTDKVIYYRRYDDIYAATDILYGRYPLRFAKLPIKKEIRIYGLYDFHQKCIQEQNGQEITKWE